MPTVKHMTAQEFEELYNAPDADEKFAKMKYDDQRMFLLRAVALADPEIAALRVSEMENIATNPEVTDKACLEKLFDLFRPSDIKKNSEVLAVALFGKYKSLDIYLDDEESDKLEEEAKNAQTEMLKIAAGLEKEGRKNPVQEAIKNEAVVWKRGQFKMSDWFTNKEYYELKLDEAAFPFIADDENIKNLFQTWLLAEKGFSLQQLSYADLTSPKEKATLGEEFLEDMVKHAFTGKMQGGVDEARENVRWFGNMYKKAIQNIKKEGVRLPGDMTVTEKEFIDMADTKAGFVMGYAHNLVKNIQNNWLISDNRPNKFNNYGIDMEYEFLSGYGSSESFESDMNNLKAFATVEQVRGTLEHLSKKPDAAKGTRAYLLLNGKGLLLNANKASEKKTEVDGDGMMEWTKVGMESAKNVPDPNAERYDELLNSNKVNKAVFKDIGLMMGADERKVKENLAKDHFRRIETAVKTINNNHKEDVYEINNYINYHNDLYLYTEEELIQAEDTFDRIFEPLVRAEQQTLKFRVGDQNNQPDDYLKGFKIGDKVAWNVAIENITGCVEGINSKKDISATSLKRFIKLCILTAMKDPGKKVKYMSRALSAEDGTMIVKGFGIEDAKKYENIEYEDMNYLQRCGNDLITGCNRVGGIDIWYHHNSKDFNTMKGELDKLSEIMSEVSFKDEISKAKISSENWAKMGAQLEATTAAISNYEQKRTGTTNKISKRRLEALKRVKGTLKTFSEIYKEHSKTKEKATEKKAPRPSR